MNDQLKTMVEQARTVRACLPGLVNAERFETVEELLASASGPRFAAWFAIRVRREPTPEYEEAIRRDPEAWKMYSAWLQAKAQTCGAGCACHAR